MVVPAHGLARWRRALAVSPFGSTAVVQQAPYLGVTVAVTALDGEVRIPGRISKAAQDIIREGTFGQCLVRIRARVLAVRDPTASPATHSGYWGTYLVSCVPYPAQLICPNKAISALLRSFLQELIPTAGWIAAGVMPACGALLKIRGAPKCPVALAHSSAIVARLRDGGWGPACLVPEVAGRWKRIVDWAKRDCGPDPRWPWAPDLAGHKRAIRKLADSSLPLEPSVGTFVDLDRGR